MTLINAWLHVNVDERWRGLVMSHYNMATALYPVGSIAVGAVATIAPLMSILLLMGLAGAALMALRRYGSASGRWSAS
ncbi:hypothetical protein D9M68_941110 [compost metagenome]